MNWMAMGIMTAAIVSAVLFACLQLWLIKGNFHPAWLVCVLLLASIIAVGVLAE